MHAALQTTELVLDILSHLDRVDLAAVARTCSRLSEPALSQIWKHLSDLGPIARLLPEGKVSVERMPGCRYSTYHINRRLDAVDIKRVQFYADFVQSWRSRQSYLDIPTEDMQQVLAGLRGQVLFPNLRELTYLGPSPYAPLILSIVGSSVTSLNVYYKSGEELGWNARPGDVDYGAERDLLLAIRAREPRTPITSLSLFILPPFFEYLRSVLTDWDGLEDLLLEADGVDPPMIMTIAALPRLKKLYIPTVNGFDRFLPALQPSYACASALSSLRLGGKSVKDALFILRPISLSELDLSGELSASDFRDIGVQMREVGITASLQKMTFRQRMWPRPHQNEEAPAHAREALLMHHIQPLLFYQGLEEVILDFNIISLMDDDMNLLARSWPHLRSISLRSAGRTRPLVTLSGILAFAQYCPELDFLELSLDASKTRVPDSANLSFPRAHHRLRTLRVGDSPISSPGIVASFLTKFFPNIVPRWLSFGGRSETHREMWSDVRTLLPILLDARMTGIHGGISPV